MDQKIKDSVLRGLAASTFSAILMYLGLRAWITMTVSIGPVDTATVIATITAFITTSIASYTAGE